MFLKGFFEKGFKIREGSVLIQIGSVLYKVFLKVLGASVPIRHGDAA